MLYEAKRSCERKDSVHIITNGNERIMSSSSNLFKKIPQDIDREREIKKKGEGRRDRETERERDKKSAVESGKRPRNG